MEQQTTSAEAVSVAPAGASTQSEPSASPSVMLAQELISEIERRREEKFKSRVKAKPRKSLYASQIPDCERQGVYEFLNWEDKKLHPWKLEALFEAGNEEELAFKAQLSELGRRSHPQFELVESGASISSDLAEKYNIHGYLDTRIKWAGKRIPVEMKLMNQHAFDSIRAGTDGIADMKRSIFYRKYIRQGLLYLLGTNEEVLIFALTDGRGSWKFVILEMDYEEAERILKVAENIKENVAAKTLPERIEYDPGICGRCAFQHICIPDINMIPSQKIEGNEKLAELFEQRDSLREKWAQYEKVEKSIKTFFENVKDGMFVIGNFVVNRKNTPTMRYEYPDDVKAKYGTKKDMFKNKIERFAKPDPELIYLEPKRAFDLSDEE